MNLSLWSRRVILTLGALLLGARVWADDAAPIAPPTSAPAAEPISTQFQVRVDSATVPVYLARVSDLNVAQREKSGKPVIANTTQTSFASFDLAQSANVTVTCPDAVQSAIVLPTSSGITPTFSGNQVTFSVAKPGPLTLEVNGDWMHSLQLFVNPPETDVPKPGDPNVIYFGPGVHQIENVVATSGQTVYLAPGAVVYGTTSSLQHGDAVITLRGSNITLRGRGIIDGSLCPHGTRSTLGIYGDNIHVEGVIVRDSGGFTVPVRRSSQVKIENIKIFGWRANSDGMDICNSHHVEVSDCYLRTFDDLIVLKTDKGQGDEADITVRHCVLWNEFAHALSLGAEIREPISNVLFTDCDVIHDKGRETVLRVFNCDSAWVKGVTFDHIRIEEARRLMSVWIGKAVWSRETERGHIADVTFQNITSVAPTRADPPADADLVGFDADHLVEDVQFRNVVVGGKPLAADRVRQNAFVRGVVITP